MKKLIEITALTAALTCGFSLPVKAETTIKIYTPDDMSAIADNPTGSYELMADLDMSETEWTPLYFAGTFEGNGHTLLNLSITSVGEGTALMYDGNMVEYNVVTAGLFGIVENAVIQNLNILNETIDVTSNIDIFVGGIAGYMANTTIRNCTLTGRLKVSADCLSFGIGGILGYGYGHIEEVEADVELISIDTNVEYKEEQFLGGIMAAGYADIDNCAVTIEAYDSDHGYVHDGGLVGMWEIFPEGTSYYGSITGNTVNGTIHFFEDNTDRRAYCQQAIGEIMNWTFTYGTVEGDFTRDEVFAYDKDLLPESCSDPVYTETIVTPSDTSFGYTEKTCVTCGYTFTDAYQLKTHSVSEWQTVKEPTLGRFGAKQGVCAKCGETVVETIDRLSAGELIPSKKEIRLFTDQKTVLFVTSDLGDTISGSWQSSDIAVAKVSDEGEVTAVGTGSAKLTFTAADSTMTSTVSVTVTAILPFIALIGALMLLTVCLVILLVRRHRITHRRKRRTA